MAAAQASSDARIGRIGRKGMGEHCRHPRPLVEPRGRRVHQRQVSPLGQDEQEVLVGQQQELPVAVAAALPGTLTRLQVDAGQDAAVEAVGVALVRHEVVEVRLQTRRRPPRFGRPAAVLPGRPRRRHALQPGEAVRADQDIATGGHRRLHDAAGGGPVVGPQHPAVGRRNAGDAAGGEQQDLRDSIEGHEMRRAVAVAPVRRGPPRRARLGIIGGQGAGGGDDHGLVDYQRRAGEAPPRRGHVVFGGHVSCPQPLAGLHVQRCQQSGATQRIQPLARHRRGAAGPGAGVRVPEPDPVGVAPDRLTGRQQIARDHLLIAPLLLGEDLLPSDRKGAHPRADGPTPQLFRRRRVPIGGDSYAPDDAVAVATTEPRPVRVARGLRRLRRWRKSFIDGRGQQPCFGGLRPAPGQVVTGVAGHPVGA